MGISVTFILLKNVASSSLSELDICADLPFGQNVMVLLFIRDEFYSYLIMETLKSIKVLKIFTGKHHQ
jgi:hypothetical protein